MAAAKRRDAVADFLRTSGCVRFQSTGYVSVVTADGQTLGIVNPNGYRDGVGDRAVGLQQWLRRKFEAWLALPAERRKPGAVEVPDLKHIDPNFAKLRPPEGGLVLRVTNRTMQRDEDGSPRYLRAEDFDSEKVRSSESRVQRFREPANDFMWIQEEEWRALVPAKARIGQSIPLPKALALRLFGYQLNPNLGVQGSLAFSPASVKAGRLTAIVEQASAESIRVRLDGYAQLEDRGGDETKLVYRPSLLGHMTYDRRRDAVTEFEMVAFGELTGRLHRSSASVYPAAPRLLGVAFQLITEPCGAENLRPNAARMRGSKPLDGYHRYLSPKGGHLDSDGEGSSQENG